MTITITTYIDDKEVLKNKYLGSFRETLESYEITYVDENKKNLKIIIDKMLDNVSIVKESIPMVIKKERMKTSYATLQGVLQLETELSFIKELAKNNFVQFEISYRIHFSKIDFQRNRLKILIKKN